MTRRFKPALLAGISALSVTFGYSAAFAADAAATPPSSAPDQNEIDVVIVTGTRQTGLRVIDSPAPVQVVDTSTLERTGAVDLETGVIDEQTGPELRSLALFRDEHVGVMRAEHPLARKKITLERFARARHVAFARSGDGRGAIDDALAALGQQRAIVTIVNGFATAVALARETDLIGNFLSRRVEGLIVIPAGEPAPRRWVHRLGSVPIVVAARRLADAEVDTVLMDDAETGRRVAADLVREGHRRIAFLQVDGPKSRTDRRRRGWEDALRTAGIEPDPRLVAIGGHTPEDGEEGMRYLLEDGGFTAVFVANTTVTVVSTLLLRRALLGDQSTRTPVSPRAAVAYIALSGARTVARSAVLRRLKHVTL